jgi:PAS domain S-box-containing protein
VVTDQAARERSDAGLPGQMSGMEIERQPGARVLGRALPAALLAMAGVNWLLYQGALRGLYSWPVLVLLLTLADGLILLLVLWRAARLAEQAHHSLRRAASGLSETMSLLAAVSDSTADPIFVKNRDGVLVFANPASLRMLGKSHEQAIGKPLGALLSGADGAGHEALDDVRALQEKISLTVEHSVGPPTSRRTFATTMSPWLGPDGEALGMVCISTDISSRKEAEDTLRARESRLEETIARRTATLRRLADHLETVREEEKRAIARELHDDMGASLTSLSMHMEGAYPLLPSDTQWTERKAKIQNLLRSLVATTRRMQTELRPTMLDLFGIKAAIHELIDDFRQRGGTEYDLSLPDEDITIGHKLEITVYRMLQEILNNVVKHAQATHVDVILDVDEDRVALTVRDNGIGISPDSRNRPNAYGLRGLQERAAFLGGTVSFSNGRNGGTVVSVQLPLTNNQVDPVSL